MIEKPRCKICGERHALRDPHIWTGKLREHHTFPPLEGLMSRRAGVISEPLPKSVKRASALLDAVVPPEAKAAIASAVSNAALTGAGAVRVVAAGGKPKVEHLEQASFDKAAYQREYMRKRREEAKRSK